MTILVVFEQLGSYVWIAFIESCLNDDLSYVWTTWYFLAVFEQLFIESCLNDDIALYLRLKVVVLERLLG